MRVFYLQQRASVPDPKKWMRSRGDEHMSEQNNKDFCPKCGTPVAESIKTSFDTFVEGYIYCWRCRTRINLEVGQGVGSDDDKKEKDQN